MRKSIEENQGASPQNYRKVLLNKKAELLMSPGINFKSLADAERWSEEDLILVSQYEVLQSSLNRVLQGQLRQVESALVRLASGGYGACLRFGASIPSKRLQAVSLSEVLRG